MNMSYRGPLETHLASYLNNKSHSIYAPVRYVMEMKGKRIRPSLLLASYEAFGKDYTEVLNQALAIEIFHNFTLLHDDIMDKADVRRGQQSVHIKWDENQAILSGDIMFSMAFDLMMAEGRTTHRSLKLFNDTASEVCIGQQMDMEFEQKTDVCVADYIEMIRLKTSVLLACSLTIGAIEAGAKHEDIEAIYDFGMKVGIAFQIQDDILDTFGEATKVGKRAGGDILRNKKTILYLKTLESGSENQKKELLKWYATDIESDQKVQAVRAIMQEVNVLNEVREVAEKYLNEALYSLSKTSIPENKKAMFKEFALSQMERTS